MNLTKTGGKIFAVITYPLCRSYCILMLLLLCCFIAPAVHAQTNLVKAEYFFDTDPGFGNGTNITVTPGTTFTNTSFSADITALPSGIHQLYLRVKDDSGNWSITNRSFLYKPSETSYGPAANIIKAEYFFDNDPGFGNGTNIPITAGTAITNASFTTNIDLLTSGIHQFYVRVKDAAGNWSITNRSFLYKPPTSSSSAVANITQAEYFFDTDPGFGNGSNIPVTAGTTISDAGFTADINSLPAGIHQFFVRVKDATGNWSISNRSFLYKPPTSGSATAANIVKAEYFFDTDPGFGSGNNIPVTPGTSILDASISANISLLSSGIHQFYVRVKDAAGNWSITNRSFFYIPGNTNTTAIADLVRAEYFIDTDPGFGNGTPVPLTPGTTLSNQVIYVTAAGIAEGMHKFYLRAQDSKGNWSISNVSNLEITAASTVPPVCPQLLAPAHEAINLPLNTTLSWAASAGEPTGYFIHIGTDSNHLSIFGTTTTSYQPALELNKTYYWRIVPYNAAGSPAYCALRSFSTITCLQPSITTQGSLILCGSQPVILTASSGEKYLWNTGDTSRSITVNLPGNYYVQVDNGNSCSIRSNVVSISRDARPLINSGNIMAICPGETLTLSYSPASGIVWSTGAVTSSINISPVVSTTYRVQGISPAGCTYTDSIQITVNPAVPPATVTHMLPADASQGQTAPFNLSWLPGANNTKYDIYLWPATLAQPVTLVATNSTAINFTVTSQMISPGMTYKWRVVSKNGNCFSTEGPVQTFSTRNLPDLVVDEIIMPSIASSGNTLSISWKVKNNGNGNTGQTTWLDHIWLSADMVLQDQQPASTDIYLGGKPNLTALQAGETYTNTASFTLPNGIGGPYYVIIKTNRYDQVQSVVESNINNNERVSAPLQIDLTPSPDLEVASIAAPLNAFSGKKISVNWTVKNNGYDISDANAYWRDKIYISFSPFFNINTATLLQEVQYTGALLHNTSYTASAMVGLPQNIFGLYYIYVIADSRNEIFESPYENNNTLSKAIDIFLTPPPDLVAQSLNAPTTGSSSSRVLLSWTVSNAGANNAEGGWYDKVYISPAPVFDIANSAEIGSVLNVDTLRPGKTYHVDLNAPIPSGYNGLYYLYVVANASNTVFEYTATANNVRRADAPIQIGSADLVVANIELPATGNSGEVFTFNWDLRNTGTDVLNKLRTDSIYISTQPSFSYASAIPAGVLNVMESLAAGSNSTRQSQIKLAPGISGNYYVYIITDAKDSIFENGNEANNRARSTNAIIVGLSASPNFIITDLVVPDTVRSAFKMPVSFSVKNTGTAAASGTSWQDDVYISYSPAWSPGTSKQVGSFTRTQPLNTNASYSIHDSIRISLTAAGNLVVNGQVLDSSFAYFHVVTDAANQVYEFGGENNNVYSSSKVYVLPPRIDLDLLQVSASDTVSSGSPAFIQWQVRNNGISTLYQSPQHNDAWLDGAYLSKDTNLDATDRYIQEWTYSGVPANGTYLQSKNFTVPNGLSGDYYLFMIVDHKNKVPEDVIRDNNYGVARDIATGLPKPIHILLTPSPDLTITEAVLPATGTAGQPVKVNWMIHNNGVGATTGSGWQDGIYLSADLTLDGSDIQIGSKAHHTNLASGQSYSDSLELNLPSGASGNYVLIIAADWQNSIYEHNAENNNTRYAFIHITMPPPSDLVVTGITTPAQAIAGSPVTITYQVKNTGLYPAAGIMSDAIYLSKDSVWDVNDALIGTQGGVINLAPNEQMERTAELTVTGTTLGNHHVIVKTDRLNNIIESSDLNNTGISENKVMIGVNQLLLNTLTPATLTNNAYLYYRIEIPPSLVGESLLIQLKGNAANASNELYIRHGDIPGRAVFDFNHGVLSAGNQELLIPELKAGTYYLACYGANSAGNTQVITLHASILPFAVRFVNSNKGGNTGIVTVQLDGSKFTRGMQVSLTGSATITAASVHFISSTKVFASFNLLGAQTGHYNVVARKSASEQAILANGFEIVTGTGGGFYVSGNNGTAGAGCDPNATNGINALIQSTIQHPSSTRPDRVVAITIFFGNSGNVDLPIPLRFLYSLSGAPLAFSVEELKENKHELSLEFREVNGPPNILRPGATGAITIYTKATAPLNFLLTD
jgi:hypothetical protein